LEKRTDLHGKTALVTGAAVRVGRGIALGLARAGADIAVHFGTSSAQAIAVADEIRAMGRRAEPVQADLSDPSQIADLFTRVEATFGRLDVLVNSAATFGRTPLAELTAQQWDAELAVTARAAALCMSKAVPLMRQAGGGAIVNITDIAAEKGSNPNFIAYLAAKGAVLAMTKAAARALAGDNIRVNAVAPGVAEFPDALPQASRDRTLAQVPMHRAGSPDDIAAAVVFLAQSDYITGQNLRVDGGWHMG
jgi:NAD(P)-dependent dehydrogenase (short-subunit alcohol dehydrogenase family)